MDFYFITVFTGVKEMFIFQVIGQILLINIVVGIVMSILISGSVSCKVTSAVFFMLTRLIVDIPEINGNRQISCFPDSFYGTVYGKICGI